MSKVTSQLCFLVIVIHQGWATLFDSRATLVTNLVDAGKYKYKKYFGVTTIKEPKKWISLTHLLFFG
jgi:hypothetical protein